jgi:hypothetical protein
MRRRWECQARDEEQRMGRRNVDCYHLILRLSLHHSRTRQCSFTLINSLTSITASLSTITPHHSPPPYSHSSLTQNYPSTSPSLPPLSALHSPTRAQVISDPLAEYEEKVERTYDIICPLARLVLIYQLLRHSPTPAHFHQHPEIEGKERRGTNLASSNSSNPFSNIASCL